MSRGARWMKAWNCFSNRLPRMIADRLELYSGAAAVALVEGLAIRQAD